MIREAITEALKAKKTSKRKCALDNGLHYTNFYDFLRYKRPLPVADIEKVLKYLELSI